MQGFAILLAFNFLGMALHALGVPLPGNVIGLILFTGSLFLGLIRLNWVEPGADFLLRHMLLFFVPVVVAVMVYRDRLASEWRAISAGLVGSLIIGMLATGWTAMLLLGKKGGRRDAARD